jgi:hypothetical protein
LSLRRSEKDGWRSMWTEVLQYRKKRSKGQPILIMFIGIIVQFYPFCNREPRKRRFQQTPSLYSSISLFPSPSRLPSTHWRALVCGIFRACAKSSAVNLPPARAGNLHPLGAPRPGRAIAIGPQGQAPGARGYGPPHRDTPPLPTPRHDPSPNLTRLRTTSLFQSLNFDPAVGFP